MFIWYHLVRVLVKPQVVLGFIPGEVWMSLWHHIGGRMMDLRRAELMQKTDFSGRPGWKTARMGWVLGSITNNNSHDMSWYVMIIMIVMKIVRYHYCTLENWMCHTSNYHICMAVPFWATCRLGSPCWLKEEYQRMGSRKRRFMLYWLNISKSQSSYFFMWPQNYIDTVPRKATVPKSQIFHPSQAFHPPSILPSLHPSVQVVWSLRKIFSSAAGGPRPGLLRAPRRGTLPAAAGVLCGQAPDAFRGRGGAVAGETWEGGHCRVGILADPGGFWFW